MIPVKGSPAKKRLSGDHCTDCGGSSLLQDREAGELVCVGCGLVESATIVDPRPEWSAFDAEEHERRSRAGVPLSWAFYDKGLSTAIGWRNEDAKGRKMDAEARFRLIRLRRWHQRGRATGSLERNLAQALNELRRIGDRLSLPRNVLETAALNYRMAARAIPGRTPGQTPPIDP